MRCATTILATALLLGLAAAALASDDEVTNKTCPVMEGEGVDPEIHVDYRGKRVYFCCESCREDFQAEPERYIAKLPQFASAAAPRGSGGEGPEEEHPLGVLHFVFVHFPIALSGVAAIAMLLSLILRARFFRNASAFCLVFAAIFAVPTFLTGGEAEEAKGKMSDSLEKAVERHETFGTISMYSLIGVALLQLVAVWRRDSVPLRWISLLAVLAVAGVVAYTGYLGGEVHLGPGHLDRLLPW